LTGDAVTRFRAARPLRGSRDPLMPAPLPERDLGRPIRVVFFGGAFLEPAALEFVARLDEHPEIEFLGGACQSPGFGLRHRVSDIVRRRALLAPVVLGAYAGRAALRLLRRPRRTLALRRRAVTAVGRLLTVSRIHDPAVLERVRGWAPDLGLVYGAPILKPELFEMPSFGTLGIHHGALPHYRGKKTSFWAMLNGEPSAGVTIQRIDSGVDTGEIVAAGEVSTAGKRYGRVDEEVQALGVDLYVETVVAVKRGQARGTPQGRATGPLYRQPALGDIVRYWCRRARITARP
jgi:folate-dependent phosphoribosylglycinamide formyltransferase PurN